MFYPYVTLEPGEPQYAKEDMESGEPIQAIYRKAFLPMDVGNPYIEALPMARDEEQVYNAYNVGLTGFNREEQIKWSTIKKCSAVTMLRQVRFVLPFHGELEIAFSMALLTSYRDRKQKLLKKPQVITVQNEDDSINAYLMGDSGAATNAGLTLLGYSGCGKSAALKILLSNYPQVLYHRSDTMDRFIQIVYLVVVCPSNSNFQALYTGIGAAIDEALGNTTPVYQKMIAKCKTVSEKANKLCELITRFGIGCIILDEIQSLNFESNRESTFESLLEIVNKTKVALMAVGTESAYQKMFTNLRMSRRTGVFISANAYCKNKIYFAAIVKELMKYQWFDEYVAPTVEIIQALYDVTHGIINQLVSVYTTMH